MAPTSALSWQANSIAIFGSCVTRDAFAASPQHNVMVGPYVGRNSAAGAFDRPLAVNMEWYGHLPTFEQRCIQTDFTKTLAQKIFAKPSELLIFDFIDERFDLVELNGTRLSANKNVINDKFKKHYGQQFKVLSRLSDHTTGLWKSGIRRFMDIALTRLPASRIVVHEAPWAPAFLDQKGQRSHFKAPYQELIRPHNDLLEEYFAFCRDQFPGLQHIRVPAEHVYADPDHKWSKEPFHYIPPYYTSFMEMLQKLT